jgi:hypothetical protein
VPLFLPLTIALLHVGDESFVENAGQAIGASAVCSMPVAPDPADALTSGDQTITGVIDGIEDGVAVVLVGADEREITCSANALPFGVRAGGVVRIRLGGDRILHMEADPDEDALRAARIVAKLEWLRENRMGKP